MAHEWATELGGEPVRLLGARALYRPATQALLIADLHLGKGDVFRRAGIGLPAGGTAHDLERLDALLASHPTRTLWVLGDLLHGPVRDAAWLQQWRQWRLRHAALDVAVVRGNHDHALQADALHVRDAGSEVHDGRWLLRHEPVAVPGQHVLCGHVHPLCELPGLARRFPAFWLREGMTVLPAFSQFTAGVAPRVRSGERLVACVDDAVVALPPAR
ncbi:MAG TPA: ligase-associated DNA damage response endonuclease PdeM [Stenotrophomonas sp.]|nr:ligase-associated DNA damage response endonuclease PdeM [Stenotrophomonas sp.]